MAKIKEPKSVTNRHIYTRASYLYQAAAYLASQNRDHQEASSKSEPSNDEHSVPLSTTDEQKAIQNTSRQLISDLKSVTLKAQIRQSSSMKRTICKFCDTFQIEGQTSTSTVENPSKGGRKPWADVLAIRCNTCGHAKRFPVSAPRGQRSRRNCPT